MGVYIYIYINYSGHRTSVAIWDTFSVLSLGRMVGPIWTMSHRTKCWRIFQQASPVAKTGLVGNTDIILITYWLALTYIGLCRKVCSQTPNMLGSKTKVSCNNHIHKTNLFKDCFHDMFGRESCYHKLRGTVENEKSHSKLKLYQ